MRLVPALLIACAGIFGQMPQAPAYFIDAGGWIENGPIPEVFNGSGTILILGPGDRVMKASGLLVRFGKDGPVRIDLTSGYVAVTGPIVERGSKRTKVRLDRADTYKVIDRKPQRWQPTTEIWRFAETGDMIISGRVFRSTQKIANMDALEKLGR